MEAVLQKIRAKQSIVVDKTDNVLQHSEHRSNHQVQPIIKSAICNIL